MMVMVLCSTPLLGAFTVWRTMLAPDNWPLRRPVASPDGYKLVLYETGVCMLFDLKRDRWR